MPPAPAPSCQWTPWAPLPLRHAFNAASLRETLAGGQAFRWYPQPGHETWLGVFGRHVARIRLEADASLAWSAATDPAETLPALVRYFGMAPELDRLLGLLPLASDPQLARAVAACPGLILLRQPFGDTLLAFILSSTKQIPQIRQLCDTLAARFGDEIAPGVHALPTWEQLAQIGEAELRRCALGFRARYVHETARHLAAHPGWLARTEALPYAEAKAALCALPGVGEKVADCVLLFGAGRLEAFPVDVWILRALAERYGLAGWKTAQLAQFGRVHFGALAGLAQQYLFAAIRQGR